MPSNNTIINLEKYTAILISLGFAAVLIILVSITMLGIKTLGTANDNLSQVVEVNHAKIELMTVMRDVIRERMVKVYTMLHLDDPFEVDEQWQQYRAYASQFIRARENLLKLGLSEDQRAQIERQRHLLVNSGSQLDQVIDLVQEDWHDAARDLIFQAQEANQTILGELSAMRDDQSDLSHQAVVQASQEYYNTRQQLILLTIIAVALCLFIVLLVVNRIRTQAAALNQALEQLAEANCTLEVRVEQRTTELMRARDENMRMSAELQVSQRLQRMLLPREEELAVPGLDIAGFMLPAEEVGGDYYDVLRTDTRLFFSIGDVTGHGLESGVVMLMVQAAVRTLLEAGITDPQEFMRVLNRTVYANLQRMHSDKSMTLVMLCYCDGNVQICGQHEEVLLVRSNGDIEKIDTFDLGFPIGIERDIGAFVSEQVVRLNPGDGIVLYTDGITEAFDVNRSAYGLDRLCAVVRRHWHLPAQQVQEAIITEVRDFLHLQYDDITLLVVKRE